MKRREQALLFLRKAAQDESLLDAVLECDSVSDEVIGFHCQQAAEKMLKALLSDLGITFHKTHELGALMDSLARSGAPLPDEFENLDVLTPFGAVYRYDDYDGTESLNRAETRAAHWCTCTKCPASTMQISASTASSCVSGNGPPMLPCT
ncbi:MAG: HEPN domain-containing protein [Candidatus Solibacter sp.]|jgi:HEPN domain-containing protein